jgi:enoyl-CoA hydratase/carnithine racemase
MSDTLTASSPGLHTHFDEGILTISLDAPERGNTLTREMVSAFVDLLQRVALNASVRVVVVQGSGADFSRGLDIESFTLRLDGDTPSVRTALECLHQWRSRPLSLLPQPVIGLVRGACQGAAIRLIEGCDLVLANDDAQFMMTAHDASVLAHHPACVHGPDWMDANTLHRLCQPGHVFSGQEAARHGLITRSCAPDALEQEVRELARAFVDKDPLALQFTKETVAYVGSMEWDAAVNFTAAKFAELKSRQAGSASARASGVSNFLAGKSKPGLGG